jgi:hypothetical protein
MRKYLVAAVVIGSCVPALAFAGEGNGPSFPGLQTPNVGITSGATSDGSGQVTTTIRHRSDAAYQPSNAFTSATAPAGVHSHRLAALH